MNVRVTIKIMPEYVNPEFVWKVTIWLVSTFKIPDLGCLPWSRTWRSSTMASISSIFIFKDGLMGCMPRQEGLLLSIEFDSSRTLTSACSGSVWPCR